MTETALDIVENEEEEFLKRPNFLGYVFCPIKKVFKEFFLKALEEYKKTSDGVNFGYYVPSGCSTTDPYENLWASDSEENLPDIIASVGFGDYFRSEFMEKFVDGGYFEAPSNYKTADDKIFSGFEDPRKKYVVYALFPKIIMVDKNHLGRLPIPKKWSDLLNPAYKNNIVIGASHGDFNDELLLYINKEHGTEGLKRLADNVKHGWHGSKMAKIAGTKNTQGAAIYVISRFFAESRPLRESTELIWPEDGAIPTPCYYLLRKGFAEKYAPFLDFLHGKEFAQKCADNYFPALHPQVNNKLPPQASFKWLGWDYIRSNSMYGLRMEVLNSFYDALWTKPNAASIFKEIGL